VKDAEGSSSGPFKILHRIFIKGLKKTTRNIREVNEVQDQGSYSRPPVCRTKVALILLVLILFSYPIFLKRRVI
jgi:hypothetical protein